MKLVDLPESPVTCSNLIAGEWQAPANAEYADIETPYNNSVIGRVPLSRQADVDAAVESAHKALAGWRQTPLKERTQVLFRFRELVQKHIERISHMEAAEAGKTVGEARAGVLKGIEIIEFALSLQNMDDGAILEVSRGVHCEIRREPMGVCVGITPFNFPSMVPMWMFPIAVTVGNAFILKPSEKVPLTACILGELMVEAGYPAGVFSIVHGDRETVEALIDHPKVDCVGFVGSTAIAKTVYARAASHGKRALALGGAKNHLIVVPDADPEVTIPGVVASFTGCAGQRCMAASLLVAVGDVDHLIDPIVEATKQMNLGTDMGAIIDSNSMERITSAIDRAESEGITVREDGRKPAAPDGYDGGNWLAPTILDNAKPDSDCATRELFGPVLTIVRVKSLEEAMALENQNHYGNATSVFTTTGSVARYVSEHGTSGMIGVNIGVPVPREPFSFGGHKDSRFGHGDMTGRGAVELWTQLKKITTKWQLQSDANWMS